MVLLSRDSTILRVVLLPGEVLGKHGQCWPCVLTFRVGKDYSALVLSPMEQGALLGLLKEFEDLFDGTLGDWDWDTEPVSFKIKEGMKPYHGRAFPIPKVHKETILKEVKRLIKLGVLECQPSSEWVSPSFIQQKKITLYVSLPILGKLTKG